MVNLFDSAFAHLSCSVHGKTAKRIQYVRSRLTWDGITLLTDDMLCQSRTLDYLKSRVIVGWLLEPREYKPENYRVAESLLPRLDLLLTHDQELIDKHPGKVRFVPFGGCWIPESHWGLHPKTKRVVQILSGKEFLPGHRLRHEIARLFPQVDCYGSGSARGGISYEERARVLARHRFAVVVENSRARNFFTEKLLDCFAVGTVPIYWGAPNIGEFFDMRGIAPFETADDLAVSLRGMFNGEGPFPLSEDPACSYPPVREINLERMKQYAITDDWISENILEAL